VVKQDTTPAGRAQRFLEALRAGDARAAEQVVNRALRSGMAVAAVQDDVIAPALREVGLLWARGEMTVADEHLATAITYRVLNTMSAFVLPPDQDRGIVLLAAVEGERHVVGLEMVARVLESVAFDVKLLGADVPVEDLAAAVARFAPAIVGLSTTMPAPEVLDRTLRAVRAVDDGVTVLVGGAGVPGRLRELPAPRYVPSAQDALEVARAAFEAAA
jgi:MerR family transcriptional regulator, light-induced transcriptional regulator